MARKISLILALALLALPPAAAHAYLPAGFIGISPQSAANSADYELMREAGIESVRLPLNWSRSSRRARRSPSPTGAASTTRSAWRPKRASGSCPSSSPRPNGWRRRRSCCRSTAPGSARPGPRSCAKRCGATGPRGAFWEEDRAALRADPPLGDLERGEHRHLRRHSRNRRASRS